MEMDEEVTVYEGQRNGKPCFIFSAQDGHSYYKHSQLKGGRISLRCICYGRRRRCKAKASIAEDGTDLRHGRNGFHNHVPPNNLFHQRRFRAAVLDEARKEENFNVSLKRLYNKVRNRMRLSALQIGGLTYVKLRSSMVRVRRQNLPPVPHSLSELALILDDPQWKFLVDTLDGKDQVYMGKFGQSDEGTRCLMFASHRMLLYMSSPDTAVEELFCDATFCLPIVLDARQIWNLCTVRNHHIIVLVRFVMQTKSEECYVVCLQALKNIIPDFKPKSVMCDFEPAQANACEAVYPLATVSGCFFHSSKAIALHAKMIGLVGLIRQNEVVDSIVRCLCALALLPICKLVEGLECIARRVFREDLFDVLHPLLEYVRKTWFRADFKRRLSVYGCPDRTTNACESANATLVSACGSKKPSMYTFLYALRELEDSTWHDVEDITLGYTPSRDRSLSALANDEIIRNLTNLLDRRQISVELFLQNASRRIQGVYDMILNF